MSLQISLLAAASLISSFLLWRMVPRALLNPNGFPAVRWGAPEAILSGAIAIFFIAMASGEQGKTPARVDMGALVSSFLLYIALAVLVVGFLVFRNFDLRKTFGLDVRGWSPWLVPAWLLVLLPLVYLAQLVSYFLSGPHQAPQAVVDFLLNSAGWRERAAVFVIAVVAAPLTEELLFRGCIYGFLRQSVGRLQGMVVSSILFAMIHGHAPSLPGLFLLALGLVLVYERCGSLWAPIGMHAAFNGLTVVAAIFWPELAR